MKASTFISVCLAAVAAGVIVFWNHRADSVSTATGIAVPRITTTLSQQRALPAAAIAISRSIQVNEDDPRRKKL